MWFLIFLVVWILIGLASLGIGIRLRWLPAERWENLGDSDKPVIAVLVLVLPFMLPFVTAYLLFFPLLKGAINWGCGRKNDETHSK